MYLKQYLIYFCNVIIFLSMMFFLSACSHKIPEATKYKQISQTKLPKYKVPWLVHLENTDKKLGNNSAFYPLASPSDAFAARLFLIDHATTSLDIQYYIYKADTIGHVFADHILLAANRGVKVRILMDDLSTTGKDVQWRRFASHPNIELRLFNPNVFRTSLRNLALLFNINSLGKRMHNKSIIADGSAAIIGGRNIGDEYFISNTKTLFLDYDILTVGKVVPEIYHAFDLYWNSKESVPSEYVLDHSDTQSHLYTQKEIEQEIHLFNESSEGKVILHSDFNRKIAQNDLTLIVADQVNFYYDHPSKVTSDENDNTTHISAQIKKELLHVDHDLVIISPYFIPSEEMMKTLKEDRAKGVNIVIITNSLASTDVFPVYSGYQDYIKALVGMGIKLYELKPDSFKNLLPEKKEKQPNALSLHTKLILMDDDRLIVGSANIDPRSDKLNTETVMIIESKILVREKRMVLENKINLENFYQLSWGEYPKEFEDDITYNGPIWNTLEKGEKTLYYAPPHVGFWKQLGTDILSILPIKGYL